MKQPSRLTRKYQQFRYRCENVDPQRWAEAVLLWAIASQILAIVYLGVFAR